MHTCVCTVPLTCNLTYECELRVPNSRAYQQLRASTVQVLLLCARTQTCTVHPALRACVQVVLVIKFLWFEVYTVPHTVSVQVCVCVCVYNVHCSLFSCFFFLFKRLLASSMAPTHALQADFMFSLLSSGNILKVSFST